MPEAAAEYLSEITCPICDHARTEQMPIDACVFFYQCRGCSEIIRPRPGDCCVFCSYGTVKCPPKTSGNCC